MDRYDWITGRERESKWLDVMQVCLAGHVINNSYKKSPEYNKDFCPTCGQKTVIQCPNCKADIPGKMHIPRVGYAGPSEPPNNCVKCGTPFPWANKDSAVDKEEICSVELLREILSNFHAIVKHLRNRHDGRPTIDVSDEYDVQDLLRGILFLHFEDVRTEEYSPSYAGKSSRIDFLLFKEKIAVEVKMTRKGLGDKEIGEQLLIDIQRYKKHPNCKNLICFIYDPEDRITNPLGLRNDLGEQTNEQLKVEVITSP